MFLWPSTNRRRILPLLCLMIAAAICLGVYLVFVPSAAKLRSDCQLAAQAGEWKSLETIARRWTRVDPNNGESWLRLGESLFRQRKYQQALESYKSVPQSSPEAETAAMSLMELQFGPLNRPIDGAITCERILEHNPQSKVARQRLIFFLAMTLQRTALVRQIRTAIESDSEPLEAFAYLFLVDSLMFSNGIESNARWLQGDPTSELFEVAQAIFIAETLDFSIAMDDLAAAQAARRDAARKDAVLQKLQTKYPHNAELLAYSIQKMIEVGDVAGVVNSLARTTVESEADARFWRFKGWVHAQRSEMDEAEASYRRAIELNPLDWVTRHMLADVLQQAQRFDEVKVLRELTVRGRTLRNALRNAPNARGIPRELLLELADFSANCGDQQTSAALRKRIQ